MADQVLNIIENIRTLVVFFSGTLLVHNLKWLGGILSLIFGVLVTLLVIKLHIIDGWFKTAGNFLLTQAFPKRHLNKSWQKILTRLGKPAGEPRPQVKLFHREAELVVIFAILVAVEVRKLTVQPKLRASRLVGTDGRQP